MESGVPVMDRCGGRLAGRLAVPYAGSLDPANRFAHQFVGVAQPQFVLDTPVVRLNRLRAEMQGCGLTGQLAVAPARFGPQ